MSTDNAPIWKRLSQIALIIGVLTGVFRIVEVIVDRLWPDGEVTIEASSLSIFVETQNDLPLPAQGKVILSYGNARISKEINAQNEAIFTEIPDGYFESENKVNIEFEDAGGEPYYAVHKDSLYQLHRNQSVKLTVALEGIDKLFGIIKDARTGDYLANARVNVLNLETFSDPNGWWELAIADQGKQKKFHTLRISKPGYQNAEYAKIPTQTNEEIIVLLKPK